MKLFTYNDHFDIFFARETGLFTSRNIHDGYMIMAQSLANLLDAIDVQEAMAGQGLLPDWSHQLVVFEPLTRQTSDA